MNLTKFDWFPNWFLTDLTEPPHPQNAKWGGGPTVSRKSFTTPKVATSLSFFYRRSTVLRTYTSGRRVSSSSPVHSLRLNRWPMTYTSKSRARLRSKSNTPDPPNVHVLPKRCTCIRQIFGQCMQVNTSISNMLEINTLICVQPINPCQPSLLLIKVHSVERLRVVPTFWQDTLLCYWHTNCISSVMFLRFTRQICHEIYPLSNNIAHSDCHICPPRYLLRFCQDLDSI